MDSIETYISQVEKTAKKITKNIYSSMIPESDLYEELYSIGLLTLVTSYNTFNPEKGSQFSSYLYCRLNGDMIDYLRSIDDVSQKDRKILKYINNINNETKKLEEKDLIEVTSKEFKTSKEHILKLLNTPSNELSSVQNMDNYINEQAITENRHLLSKLFKNTKLSNREKHILYQYYFEYTTIPEIAKTYNLSKLRIYQIQQKALAKLKTTYNELTMKITPEERKEHKAFLKNEKKKDSESRKKRSQNPKKSVKRETKPVLN